jgi:hypothetical protein
LSIHNGELVDSTMPPEIWKHLRIFAAGVAVCGVAIAAVAGVIWDEGDASSRVAVEPILSVGPVKDDSYRLWITVSTQGFCRGIEERPRLEKPLEIIEEANGRATVTGSVRYSARRDGYCMAVGYGIGEKVRFARPVDGLVLYDGSTSRPQQIWPR